MLEEHGEEEDRLDDNQTGFFGSALASPELTASRLGRLQTLHRSCDLQEQTGEKRRRDEQRGKIPHAALDLVVHDGLSAP